MTAEAAEAKGAEVAAMATEAIFEAVSAKKELRASAEKAAEALGAELTALQRWQQRLLERFGNC